MVLIQQNVIPHITCYHVSHFQLSKSSQKYSFYEVSRMILNSQELVYYVHVPTCEEGSVQQVLPIAAGVGFQGHL